MKHSFTEEKKPSTDENSSFLFGSLQCVAKLRQLTKHPIILDQNSFVSFDEALRGKPMPLWGMSSTSMMSSPIWGGQSSKKRWKWFKVFLCLLVAEAKRSSAASLHLTVAMVTKHTARTRGVVFLLKSEVRSLSCNVQMTGEAKVTSCLCSGARAWMTAETCEACGGATVWRGSVAVVVVDFGVVSTSLCCFHLAGSRKFKCLRVTRSMFHSRRLVTSSLGCHWFSSGRLFRAGRRIAWIFCGLLVEGPPDEIMD